MTDPVPVPTDSLRAAALHAATTAQLASGLSEAEIYERLTAHLIAAEAPDAQEPKPWWRSTTIVGALTVLVSQGAALAGYSLDAGALLELGTNLVGLIGGALALWGRLRATAPIARRAG